MTDKLFNKETTANPKLIRSSEKSKLSEIKWSRFFLALIMASQTTWADTSTSTPPPQQDSTMVDDAGKTSPENSNEQSVLNDLLTALQRLNYQIKNLEDGSIEVKSPKLPITMTVKFDSSSQSLILTGRRHDEIAGRIVSLKGLDAKNVNQKAAEILSITQGIFSELMPARYRLLDHNLQREVGLAVYAVLFSVYLRLLKRDFGKFGTIMIASLIWTAPMFWKYLKEEAKFLAN